MSMKKIFIAFVCDNCGKESKPIASDSKFPYDKKWIYLYNINGKNELAGIIEAKDKHFCSGSCMLEFIEDKFRRVAHGICPVESRTTATSATGTRI
jgi:hypothetical protein